MASSKQSTNSHDDSIIIEVEDSPAATTRKSTRNSRLKVEDSSSSTKLCEFPVGHKDTVTVSSQDYATLEHDTFLNDIIIDFYLTHLFYNVLPSKSKDSIHIFSTMFYKRLLQAPKKDAKKVAAFETDPSLSKEEKQHLRVAGWTKNVDLFNKDFVIIPICENSHWYLVVVVKPGMVNVAGEKKDSPAESQKGTYSSVESEKRKDILAESQKGTDSSVESEKRKDILVESEKRTDSSVESEKRKDILAESQKGTDSSVESEKRKDILVESEKRTDSSVETEKGTDTSVVSKNRTDSPVESEKRTYSDEKTDTSNLKDAERKTENQEDSKARTDNPENSEEITDITEDHQEKTNILDDSEEKTNNAEDSVEKKDQGKSFFLVLDSLGGTKRSSVTNLKNYLSYEWRSKKLCGELPLSFKQMKTIHPKKPEQENGSDCGIFLLHYAEKIFQDLDQFLQPDLPDLSHWFTMEEVGKKRAAIAVLIRRLAIKQQIKGGDTPNFPNIKFKDESTARKSSKLINSTSNSPVKDVNENVSKNEAVRCMKVTTRYVTTRSTCSKKGHQEKSAKRSSPSTNKESETSLEDDFSFDPSIYSDTTAVCSEMSEPTKSSPNTASTISTSVSTSSASSSSPTNADAMSSSYTATSDTKSSISAVPSDAKSSISSGISLANEASANFMEAWNASKNNLVLGDYARFPSTSTAKQDGKVKRKRPGVDTFKSLQISKTDDGNTSSRSRSGASEMNK